jgi:hypothetical protein
MKLTNKNLEFLAQYAAMRTGCEKALELLEDPDASEFDANKVIQFLRVVLGDRKCND